MAEIMANQEQNIVAIKLNYLILFAIASSLLYISCEEKKSVPYYNDAEFNAQFISDISEIKSLHTIPNFAFMDQDSNLITQQATDGNIYIANFFFTLCPSICPPMMEELKKVRDAFEHEDNVLMLSHSITPWIDTVGHLKEYAVKHDIPSEKWYLLTGSEDSIYQIARHGYFSEKEIGLKLSNDDYMHTENVILVDQNRHIRGIYRGTNPEDIGHLIEDIGLLLRDKNN